MCNERSLDSVYSRKEKSRPFSVETIKDRRPIRPIGPNTRKTGGCNYIAHFSLPFLVPALFKTINQIRFLNYLKFNIKI